jgi:hypothetical protein
MNRCINHILYFSLGFLSVFGGGYTVVHNELNELVLAGVGVIQVRHFIHVARDSFLVLGPVGNVRSQLVFALARIGKTALEDAAPSPRVDEPAPKPFDGASTAYPTPTGV